MNSRPAHILHATPSAFNHDFYFGSDFDGGFGKEQSPHDLATIVDLQKIPEILRQKGYKEAEIEGVMHANWLRFFEKAWTKPPR